jgi:hypothetical protein
MFGPIPFPVHASACSLIHVIAAARVVGVLISRAIALRLLLASEWQLRTLLGVFSEENPGVDEFGVDQGGRLIRVLGWIIECFGSTTRWLGSDGSNQGAMFALMAVLVAQLGIAAMLWMPDKRPRKVALWVLLSGVVVQTVADGIAGVELSGFIADLAKVGTVVLAEKLCL